jgi:hypothetical protein
LSFTRYVWGARLSLSLCVSYCGPAGLQALELLAYEANMVLAAAPTETVHAAAALAAHADVRAALPTPALALPLERGGRVPVARATPIDAPVPAGAGSTVYSAQLLCVLLSAMAKIAARSPDLTPRVLLCFSKLVKVSIACACTCVCVLLALPI